MKKAEEPLNDSIELKIPKFALPAKFLTAVLVILLIIASFFVGSLYTKVKYLEQQKNSAATQGTTNPNTVNQNPNQPTADDIKKWAGEIGLDTQRFNSCFNAQKYTADIDKDTQDGKTGGVSGTPSFFIDGHLIVGALPYSIFQKVLDFELRSGDWSAPDDSVKDLVDGNQNNGEIDKNKQPIALGHFPIQGNPNAKITVVEFSDFQCPYCNQFFKNTLPQIRKDYIDSGKVALYYRHFPLEFHPMARPFAIASECANEQGKFWQMHNKIFQSQG